MSTDKQSYMKQYRLDNKERCNKHTLKWQSKNRNEVRNRLREANRIYVRDLARPYVANVIHMETGIKISDIPEYLIEAKRAMLRIKRLLKEKRQ